MINGPYNIKNFVLLLFVLKYLKCSSLSKDLLPQCLVEYIVKIFTLDVPLCYVILESST
jgi:Cytidylyltransferase C-terminal domain (DUF2432).